MVDQIIARVNNPRNKQWFELLGISPVVSATDLILRLIEHEVPKYGLVHLLDLPQERLEIIELLLGEASPVDGSAGRGPRAAGGEPADLGAARRDGVRAGAGDGAGARRRGARRPRSGDGGGAEGVLRPRRLGRLSDGRPQGRLTCWSAGSPPRTARRSCGSGGADGSILLVGREPHAPYERPPLSKEYLRGESAEEDALVNRWTGTRQNGVELLTETSVMSLDVGGADGEAADQGGGGVRGGADRHGGAGEHPPPPRGSAAGGDPLPAGARQLGRDPRRRRRTRTTWC